MKKILLYGRDGAGKFALGNYPTEEDAAHVYDQFAMQLFGEYARLNLLC